jgi:hypothetical protein
MMPIWLEHLWQDVLRECRTGMRVAIGTNQAAVLRMVLPAHTAGPKIGLRR